MKCYMVYVDRYDYDEYDACIVLADSEEEVRSMFKREKTYDGYITKMKGVYFDDHQGEIHIKEVTKKGLVLASFNAG